jgi:hypothetical protein
MSLICSSRTFCRRVSHEEMSMTVSVTNISGSDRIVPLPDGSTVTVLAGNSYGFPDAIGNGLLLQTGVWQPGGSATNVSLVVQVNGNLSLTVNVSGSVPIYTNSGRSTLATFPATITQDTTYYSSVYGLQTLKVSLKDQLGYEHWTSGTATLDPGSPTTTIQAAGPLGNATYQAGLGLNVATAAGLGAVPAVSVPDATVSASSTSVTSPGGHFTPAMNGQQFYFLRAGPVLVTGTYAWEASPLVGTFTYVSSTAGTLSVAATTAVAGGEIIIGPNATAAINAAVALGNGYLPPGDFIVTGEIAVGSHKRLLGAGRKLTRIFSTVQQANVITSAWSDMPEVRDLSVYGNGYGAQPTNTDPGTGVTPNWANAGCGVIFANVTQGRIENVDVFHCGGDAVTTGRNGIAGIYITMGCIETQVVGCRTTYCRNGINEDNFFSGVGQAYNPLSNTFDRNTTNYCRFGMAIDSGSLSRGACISNHVARFCVANGIDIHSSNFVTILSPRCEFNGVNFTGSGIQIYGTSSTVTGNHITVIGPTCHANGQHGIKVSDWITNWRVIGGICTRNFRHGLYANNQANDGQILGLGVRDNGQGNDSPGSYDGVHVSSCLRVDVQVNALDDQGSPTQNYGVRADGSSDYITVNDASKFTGNAVAAVSLIGSNSRNAARSRASVLNAAQGLKGEPFSRATAIGSTAQTAGDLRVILVPLIAGDLVSSVFWHQTVAGSGVTLFKVAVFDASGNRVAVSADASSTATSGTGLKSAALATPYLVPNDGGYYLGAVSVGGTSPTLVRGASAITGYDGSSGSGQKISAVQTAQTDAPSTATLVASGTAFWFGWA